MNASVKTLFAQRKKARLVAVQALYQWLISETALNELLAQSRMDNVKKAPDWPFFDELVRGVVKQAQSLDESYSPLLDRPFDQISPIEKSILRLGVFELHHCLDVPYQVVLNEYIELAKLFGATDSYKYVNSILHGVAKESRPAEVASHEESQTQ